MELPGLLLATFLCAVPARAAEPAPLLSQTGLYLDIASKTVDPANELFTPQYPLWSDGAEKSRWIRLPPGAKIDTTDMDRWVFPVGTKFWKEFSFRGENGKRQRVETRILEKLGPDAWSFASYAWSGDESDAALVSASGARDVFPIGGGLRHDIPSAGECRFCHARGGDRALGFEALQLSKDGEGSPGPGLDLEALVARGLLTRAPESRPRITAATPAGRAARGYLHGNCGHCHNPQGAASRSGMFVRYQIQGVPREADQPIFQTAVGRLTQRFKIPGRDETFRIKPGDSAASAVYYRMSRRVGFPQMPPMGTKKTDSEGLAAVLEWIEEFAPARARADRGDRFRAIAERLRAEMDRTRERL